jgi:two-component system, NtrC family, sensor kinase
MLFSRQGKAERRAVDLHGIIRQILTLRDTQLVLASIRLETELGATVPSVLGNPQQLQQVLLNLVLNAEQAILGSGVGGDCIRVSTSARSDGDRTWVVVEVADNGPGIPAEVLPRVFEPFFTTKKVGEGAGLGLSVSYGIVEQYGGRLSVESRPGRSVFTLELPVASPQETRTADPAPAVSPGSR